MRDDLHMSKPAIPDLACLSMLRCGRPCLPSPGYPNSTLLSSGYIVPCRYNIGGAVSPYPPSLVK